VIKFQDDPIGADEPVPVKIHSAEDVAAEILNDVRLDLIPEDQREAALQLIEELRNSLFLISKKPNR